MTTKHTPGPWKQSKRNAADIYDGAELIASAHGPRSADHARLIAAARELLEVSEMVNHVIQQWRESGREPSYGQWENLQDIARAAIAKATS